MAFSIVSESIVPPVLDADGAGGFVIFEGKVRNRNEGRTVHRLEYEAYIPLAEAEGERIVQEAVAAFGLEQATALHRIGLLQIGETAVWVGVAAAHREEGFRACAYIVDELKRRVPIWKKEFYADGDSEWIGCHDENAPDVQQELYRRQIKLPEVGPEGQSVLANAKVLVVGAGGLGCAALPYLVSAGIGKIGIADGDVVEASNLHRQVLFGLADRGLPKAETAAKSLRRQNPNLAVQTHGRLDASNATEIVADYDIVLDGTDNFAAKFLLNDACVELGKPLVQASLHRFEGQLLTMIPGSAGGCLRCLWPEAPFDGCVGSCAEDGILGAVAGVFGTLEATEVLKIILNLDGILADAMLTLDLRSNEIQRFQRQRNPNCPVCGSGTKAEAIDVDLAFAKRLGLNAIDIREPDEWSNPIPFEEGMRVPLSDWAELETSATAKSPVLLICERGVRSAQAARRLRESGIEAYSLFGGAKAHR